MIKVIQLISLFNLACINRNKFIDVPFNKTFNNLVMLLIQSGVAIGYSFLKNQKSKKFGYIRIFINPRNFGKKPITLVSKPSIKKIVKYSHITKLINNKTTTVYIVSTSQGYLNLEKCLEKCLGGILLAFIE